MTYSSLGKSWVGMWALAAGNMNIVKRSNALLNYNDRMIYYEGLKFPGFFYGFNYTLALCIFGTCLFFPPLSYILRKFILPSPG